MRFKVGDRVIVDGEPCVVIFFDERDEHTSYPYEVMRESDGITWWTSIASLHSNSEYEEGEESSQDFYDAHYKEAIVEPILIMEKFFNRDEVIGFLKGNILKYRMRFGLKEGQEEIKEAAKIRRYQQWLHEFQDTGRITV